MRTIYARNLAQIIDGTLRLCGDFVRPGGNGRKYARDEITSVANDALLNTVRDLGLLKEWGIIQLTKDIAIYQLPPDCLRPLRLCYHGTSRAYIVLPASLNQIDLYGGTMTATGSLTSFFRDHLAYNQIAVLPVPSASGSATTASPDTYGLLRGATGDIAIDPGSGALRSVGGMDQFIRMGSGSIVRGIASPDGNIEINYLRSPRKMILEDDYPDEDIPDWIHPDLKFLIAAKILAYKRDRISRVKAGAFANKWLARSGDFRKWIEQDSTFYRPGVSPL
ncbi:MAG: hypothetical protein AAGU11_09955 [Syntrophobacteraceae bacterium]